MGGQACVLYGAAEFSRDTDLTLFASKENLDLLTAALRHLQARRIAVPPFELSYLQKGHALHFRSYHPEAFRMRIDIMSVMRGVDAFDHLWQRRIRHVLPQGEVIEVLSRADLVQSKKTQQDKDWPMIRRLVESDYVNVDHPSEESVLFWLKESRTPRMLMELVHHYKEEAEQITPHRPLLALALEGNESAVEDALEKEQKIEREADRRYWTPLFRELEKLRRNNDEIEEPV